VPLLAAAGASLLVTQALAREPRIVHGSGLATRKEAAAVSGSPVLATLVQTHTPERVLLEEDGPPSARLDALLADRITGSSIALDPRLFDLVRGLVRTLARKDPEAELPRIELVSGFRSPKLNERMRKKGHHVASHSQHSLGHALDFRIVLAGAARGLDPREIERAIRAAGWDGGVGVYLGADDWFVHADVGPRRSWSG
jgi:uncharacterized protein YcbK (DUF882 family)